VVRRPDRRATALRGTRSLERGRDLAGGVLGEVSQVFVLADFMEPPSGRVHLQFDS
jgi:hypothetical protein